MAFPHFLSNQTWHLTVQIISRQLSSAPFFRQFLKFKFKNQRRICLILPSMNYRRDHRSSRTSLLNDLEEGGLRSSSSYSHDINEHDNDKAVETLEDRVIFLKRLTGDIHNELESHNRFLDRMGNDLDASRGIMSGTMDRFKMVFAKKSSRRMCTLVTCFVVSFLIIYYLIRILRYLKYG